MKDLYISCGSNLGDKRANIVLAYKKLGLRVGKIVRKSSFYQSESWGFQAESDFLNTVIVLETTLSADEILAEIKKIEQEMGRIKVLKDEYESRIIDLDIISLDLEIIEKQDFVVPHKHIEDRKFVLVPLLEVDKHWVHAKSNKKIEKLLRETKDNSQIQKISN